MALLVLGLVFTGPVVAAAAGPLGIGSTAQTLWGILKWPATIALVLLILGILYRLAPNVPLRGSRWFTPGAVTALVIWMIPSIDFAFYVGNFGSCDKT